jgi:uncharacterized metal-binding protein
LERKGSNAEKYLGSTAVHEFFVRVCRRFVPIVLGVKIVISYMADADEFSGLMITSFRVYWMCTYCYGIKTSGVFRSSSAL